MAHCQYSLSRSRQETQCPTPPLRVKLEGSHIGLNEFGAFDKMIRSRGLRMHVIRPATKFVTPWLERPIDLPHAAYCGKTEKTADALHAEMTVGIRNEIQPDILVSAREAANSSLSDAICGALRRGMDDRRDGRFSIRQYMRNNDPSRVELIGL